GDVIVFTPKRLGRDFEMNRSFAIVEGGKWVGAARAGFDGVVVAHKELLARRPALLNADPYGEGWMLIGRASHKSWRTGLVTGTDIAPTFEGWLATGAYKDRGG